MSEPIQSLWIGGGLSPMEQLSAASFLAQGHEYHLYSYGVVGNLPEGAILKSAEAILPRAAVFHIHADCQSARARKRIAAQFQTGIFKRGIAQARSEFELRLYPVSLQIFGRLVIVGCVSVRKARITDREPTAWIHRAK